MKHAQGAWGGAFPFWHRPFRNDLVRISVHADVGLDRTYSEQTRVNLAERPGYKNPTVCLGCQSSPWAARTHWKRLSCHMSLPVLPSCLSDVTAIPQPSLLCDLQFPWETFVRSWWRKPLNCSLSHPTRRLSSASSSLLAHDFPPLSRHDYPDQLFSSSCVQPSLPAACHYHLSVLIFRWSPEL